MPALHQMYKHRGYRRCKLDTVSSYLSGRDQAGVDPGREAAVAVPSWVTALRLSGGAWRESAVAVPLREGSGVS